MTFFPSRRFDTSKGRGDFKTAIGVGKVIRGSNPTIQSTTKKQQLLMSLSRLGRRRHRDESRRKEHPHNHRASILLSLSLSPSLSLSLPHPKPPQSKDPFPASQLTHLTNLQRLCLRRPVSQPHPNTGGPQFGGQSTSHADPSNSWRWLPLFGPL